jgi:hypothetical protein
VCAHGCRAAMCRSVCVCGCRVDVTRTRIAFTSCTPSSHTFPSIHTNVGDLTWPIFVFICILQA